MRVSMLGGRVPFAESPSVVCIASSLPELESAMNKDKVMAAFLPAPLSWDEAIERSMQCSYLVPSNVSADIWTEWKRRVEQVNQSMGLKMDVLDSILGTAPGHHQQQGMWTLPSNWQRQDFMMSLLCRGCWQQSHPNSPQE